MIKSKFSWSLMAIVLLVACGSDNISTPKPRAFPKIEFPSPKGSTTFEGQECPFEFEFAQYHQVERDTAFFNELPTHPCWFDLVTPSLNARIHFSYYPVGGEKSLETLVQDAFKLSSKHNTRANYIEETRFSKSKDVGGLIFRMEGPVATPYQIFITDSAHHFLRGALYVNAQARPDSLKPIYEFIEKDIDQMLSTFKWK